MHDAVLQYTELAEGKSDVLERLGLESKQYALGTVHRAENTDDLKSLKGILVGLAGIAQESLPVIFPIHPRTRKLLSSLAPRLLSLTLPDHLRFIALVSYLDMLTLEKHAKMVLTDSGGVQKEAFFFGVPCFTLREETEWVETANSGCNVLVGCEPSRIIEAALKANSEQDVVYPYGDGQAAARIVGLLERVL
jgi:UDP-N-acetylglucosamine 2-epimerase